MYMNNSANVLADNKVISNELTEERSTLAILALVLSIFVSVEGIILAVVGLKDYKKTSNRALCYSAILLASAKIALFICYFVVQCL